MVARTSCLPVKLNVGEILTLIRKRNRATVAAIKVVVFSVLPLLAVASYPQSAQNYAVLLPVANMYRAPDRDSDVVSQAIYASNVEVIEKKDQWSKVRTADQYAGWMESISLKDTGAAHYAANGRTVRVGELSANIYREPDIVKRAPIINVPWEARLEVISDVANEDHQWLKVRLPDGREGYVQGGDVSTQSAPLTISQTIDLARKFLGITYTWGGTSSYGYDCSGFTQMLLRQRGILMPRDADVQAAWTGLTAVSRDQLQPGDLLFFGSKADDITHTGMYIGNGEFIHDTTHEHPMVQISKLADMPWTKLLVAARRARP